MFISSAFTINGVSSTELGVTGVKIIRTDGGPVTAQMMGDRTVKQEKLPKSDVSILYDVEQNNIEFDLKLAFSGNEDLSPENLLSLTKDFSKTKYVPFTSAEYPGKVFYVITTTMHKVRNGDFKGWLELHLVTPTPYAFFEPSVEVFDLSSIAAPTNIELINPTNVMSRKYGDYIYQPKLIIELKGATTSFSLSNISSGEICSMTDLTVLETITLDNEHRRIVSSTGSPRISHLVNRNWFRLIGGTNVIQVDHQMILTANLRIPVYI